MMKSMIGIGALTLLLTSATWAHDESQHVDYRGDISAKRVCLSIVEDNVVNLKAALRSDRLRHKRLADNQDTYQCNGMALVDFAEVNASYKAANFLAPERLGRVDIEDVASR